MNTETDSRDASEILKAEEELREAVGRSDWTSVEACLADDFTHTHTSGHTEDKVAWLEHMSHKKLTIAHRAVRVRHYGEFALLSGGIVNLNEEDNGTIRESPLDILQVWMKSDGKWKLVANHTLKAISDT